MKILLVVMKERRAIIDGLYDSIEKHNPDFTLLRLSSTEQDNLQSYFKQNVDIESYDRIVFVLRTKKMFRQPTFFQQIKNLAFLEYDACQNYSEGKNKGKFSRFYSGTPWARLIVSSHTLAEKLRKDGFDATFVPKGFDDSQLRNLHLERSIELGFIGSTNNSIYVERVRHLEEIAAREPLKMLRTYTPEEYLNRLNSIKFFVSADLGYNEYMLKNFEAMACGCVVFAYNHGVEESESLGLSDMENIVLYRDLEEFFEKLHYLRENPNKVTAIAKNGQALVEQHNSFSVLGEKIIAALRPNLRSRTTYPPRQIGLIERLKLKLN